jgi:hypothetical protein
MNLKSLFQPNKNWGPALKENQDKVTHTQVWKQDTYINYVYFLKCNYQL